MEAEARPVLRDANSVFNDDMAPPIRRSISSVSKIKSSDMSEYHTFTGLTFISNLHKVCLTYFPAKV